MTHRPPHRPSSARGFSLAEVLIAVALLAVIILAVFGLVSAGVRRAYGGKKMTQASAVAQSALERMNVQKPQDLLGAAGTDASATITWTKTAGDNLDSHVTAAAEGGATPTPVQATRNAVRTLLVNSDLPATAARPATLTITMTPVPASVATFDGCTMVRIEVDLLWWEFGTRQRRVHLETMNLKTVPV
jgi:prepilin-type N-terminal cleavage/methylation domain-containing protein